MEPRVWIALVTLFAAGALTPGPAVMLVTTSAMRYGLAPSMPAAIGICAANLLWVALAASGASALARAFPAGFLALKVAGLGYILLLAWRTAHAGTIDLTRREPPPRARLFGAGVGRRRRPARPPVHVADVLGVVLPWGRGGNGRVGARRRVVDLVRCRPALTAR